MLLLTAPDRSISLYFIGLVNQGASLNILENAPVLNSFILPEHLNSWENETVFISGKMTLRKKQSPARITFSSREDDMTKKPPPFTELTPFLQNCFSCKLLYLPFLVHIFTLICAEYKPHKNS